MNADLCVNGDVWNSPTPHQQKAIEVVANAPPVKVPGCRISENGKALKDSTENHGVILHNTPGDHFPAFVNAARATLEKNPEEGEFFSKVWQSQKEFAEIAIPFWAGARTLNASPGKGVRGLAERGRALHLQRCRLPSRGP